MPSSPSLPEALPAAAGLAEALLAASLAADGQGTAGSASVRPLIDSAVRVDAVAVADALKAEAERQLHVLPARSAAIAAVIAALGQAAKSNSVLALGEMACADALREQGRYPEALQAYGRSAVLYLAAGDEVGWARSRIGAAGTHYFTGELGPALVEAERAREILVRHGLWVRLARLESIVGLLLREQGRNAEALEAYERALAAAARLARPEEREPLEAELHINQAATFLRQDEYARAEALLKAAAETFRRHSRPAAMALAEANRARVLAAQGHLSRALALVSDTRSALIGAGRAGDAALVGQIGVDCLMQLNRPAEAASLADAVVSELEADGAGIELAKTLLQRAIALQQAGQGAAAATDLRRAEDLFRAEDCAGWVATVRLQRAELSERAGAWHVALREARVVGAELRRQGQVVAGARADLVRARALRALGRTTAAVRAARNPRAVARGRGVPWLAYQAWRLLGELALDRGQEREARRVFGRAIGALEEGQGRILTEQRASFLQDKLGVYEEVIRLWMRAGDARRAFDFAERAKARALLDALALRARDVAVRPRTPAARALAGELTTLRRRHDGLSAEVFDSATWRGEAGAPIRDRGRDEALRVELMRCEARIGAVLEELRLGGAADVERLALLQGRVYSPLRHLDARTALVEYVVVRDEIAIFVARRGRGMRAVWAPGNATAATAARLRSALELNLDTAAASRGQPASLLAMEAHARMVLQRLFDLLLAPVLEDVHGVERLVIVPHGVLHQIPFAALHDGERFLVESHEVVLAPSASTVGFCRRPLRRESTGPNTHGTLVIAHSGGGALPDVLEEADMVAALFPGACLVEEAATAEALRERAPRAGLIHLAAHGFSRPDAPLFSHVRLASGELTALDCLDLELDCALVTLSACESGRAVVAPGDEPIGLTRSLLYAGARSVLQSLWRVEDGATARLMGDVYRGLRAGAGRAAALRAAQRTYLANAAGAAARHPFFWAAFSLVGDWGPLGRDAIGSTDRQLASSSDLRRSVEADDETHQLKKELSR